MSTNSVSAPTEFMPVNAISAVDKPKRYHPAMVALHWLVAILIFGAFFLSQGGENERGRFRPGQGNFSPQGFQQGNPPFQGGDDEAPPANFQPQIQQGTQSGNQTPRAFPQGGFPQQQGSQNIFSTIGLHMIFGLVVLVLLVVRLIVRWTTKHPEWASAGNKFFDWVGVLTHWGLYLLTFAMVITGIILADQRGMLARIFGIGTFTPGDFRRGGFSLGLLHGAIWTLLLLLILLHVGAALYHQFIIKDNLMGRVWFGKKNE
jgi:cytochrome b561